MNLTHTGLTKHEERAVDVLLTEQKILREMPKGTLIKAITKEGAYLRQLANSVLQGHLPLSAARNLFKETI